MEEGDIASFFAKDLGLALAPKTCPDQSQAFKDVKNSQAFTVGIKKNEAFRPMTVETRCRKVFFPNSSKKEPDEKYARTAAMGQTGKKCLLF